MKRGQGWGHSREAGLKGQSRGGPCSVGRGSGGCDSRSPGCSRVRPGRRCGRDTACERWGARGRDERGRVRGVGDRRRGRKTTGGGPGGSNRTRWRTRWWMGRGCGCRCGRSAGWGGQGAGPWRRGRQRGRRYCSRRGGVTGPRGGGIPRIPRESESERRGGRWRWNRGVAVRRETGFRRWVIDKRLWSGLLEPDFESQRS